MAQDQDQYSLLVIFLSFLYTLYGQVSGKSSEVAIELSILVSWIATNVADESQGKPAIPVFFFFFFCL